MKIIIETFVTVIFVTLSVLLTTQLIESQLAISAAKNFHTNVVQVVEESNFNESVIEECMIRALDEGYTLEVVLDYTETMQCLSCNSLWESNEEINCVTCGSQSIYTVSNKKQGQIILTYGVNLVLLDIEREGMIVANAR